MSIFGSPIVIRPQEGRIEFRSYWSGKPTSQVQNLPLLLSQSTYLIQISQLHVDPALFGARMHA